MRDNGNRLSLAFSFIFENAEDTKFGSFDPNAVRAIRQSVENDLLKIVPKAQAYWEGSADYQWYVLQGISIFDLGELRNDPDSPFVAPSSFTGPGRAAFCFA